MPHLRSDPLFDPPDAPLPLGYAQIFVHELEEDALTAAGGPVTFFTAWLDRAAGSSSYARARFRWQQAACFSGRRPLRCGACGNR